ncbi:hypothetical protein AAL_07551 [Moelleriella libera RCEF 2490]|uniref:Uncharacterized protein n=1 Tax=Moelleriella libera RCEF 2490 TaxID=1081109 RepID=A0A167X5M4_9HYPO|nr:hypothetical protein AAL_07551 [Moelleriella libera RCEF 2490]
MVARKLHLVYVDEKKDKECAQGIAFRGGRNKDGRRCLADESENWKHGMVLNSCQTLVHLSVIRHVAACWGRGTQKEGALGAGGLESMSGSVGSGATDLLRVWDCLVL